MLSAFTKPAATEVNTFISLKPINAAVYVYCHNALKMNKAQCYVSECYISVNAAPSFRVGSVQFVLPELIPSAVVSLLTIAIVY